MNGQHVSSHWTDDGRCKIRDPAAQVFSLIFLLLVSSYPKLPGNRDFDPDNISKGDQHIFTDTYTLEEVFLTFNRCLSYAKRYSKYLILLSIILGFY